MRKTIIWVLALVMLAAAVLAAQPPAQVYSTPPNLQIAHPQVNEYLTGTEANFYFQVFNSTAYSMTNETTNCTFDIYSTISGKNLHLDATGVPVSRDFVVTLNSTVMGTADMYGWVIRCENGGEAGYSTGQLEVSVSQARETALGGFPLAVVILIPMILGIMLIIGTFMLDPEEHAALRIGMLLMALMSYFASMWLGMQVIVRYYVFPVLQDGVGTLIWLFGALIGVIVTYFIIFAFFKLVQRAAQKRKEMMGI